MLSAIVAIIQWVTGGRKDAPQEPIWSEEKPLCPWCLSPDQSYVAFTNIVPSGTYRCTKCNRVWRKVIDKSKEISC